uniref:enoyl-[acyl-carrier-protein] reductase, mitochondrial isoform X2 n=1 Tax=Myxine glutinosa TaxID=7769 RepID=UPI00358FDDA1
MGTMVFIGLRYMGRFGVCPSRFGSLTLGSRGIPRRAVSALVFRAHGDPAEVLRLEELELPALGETEVKVRMLAAPINPADINMVQGSYAILPSLPAVGGNEGVAEVEEVGAKVDRLKRGDWVVPSDTGFGDFLIQNGANSGVGQSVIQIAASMGVKTINIVRKRPELEALIAQLKALGADHVFTEEDLRKPALNDVFKDAEPRLALNCVGGKATVDMLRHLVNGGTMVTYGGMSRKPVTVPTSALIFRNLNIRGFWVTQWKKDNAHDPSRFDAMLEELAALCRTGRLVSPALSEYPLKDYREALDNAMQPYSSRKQLIVM